MKFAFLLLLGLTCLASLASAKDKESVYDRVIKSGTIRCAYFPFAPNLVINEKTGERSGIFNDLTEEIGKRLGLKIEWAEEVDYGTIIQGFETGRYDMFCNTVWPTPERSKQAVFSIPLYYGPESVFVREDDRRFDKDYRKLNNQDYTLAIRDGDVSDSVQKVFFPKAKTVSVPQLSGIDQLMTEVITKKADATITEPLHIIEYNRHNEKKLRNITLKNPLKFFPNTYMMPAGEFQFKQMLDVTIAELLSEGYIDILLEKYVPEKDNPGAVYRVRSFVEPRKL